MLIFDQLKKNDPQLRLLTLAVSGGMFVLLAGLWWVQVVSARDYEQHQETQSFRTVRIPGMRGKIFDRTGTNVLAENRPTYNVSLYLEELRGQFDSAYNARAARAKNELAQHMHEQEKRLGRKLTWQEKKPFLLDDKKRSLIHKTTRYEAASNVVMQVSQRLQQPLALDFNDFELHYEKGLVLPYPIVKRLDPRQIARFEEQSTSPMGVDLEIQSTRVYPYETTAAHVLGYLQRDDESQEGEDPDFNYRLPDYRGTIGVEFGFDSQLRGHAGVKSVLVNSLGYRQTENVWTPAEPGANVTLTIDLRIQQAVEKALPVFGPKTRGAAVVMDVHTGDILALASSPAFNPNVFAQGISASEYQEVEELGAEKNRATYEQYAPGSIFKTVTAIAALEAGLDPAQEIDNPGYIFIGRRQIHDLAAPGRYDFRRALKLSSNTYFITNGIRAGIENIARIGGHLHLGERTGLLPLTRQESPGDFPSWNRIHSGWLDGDTANVCIGQGEVAVTPMQMAVLASAIANGGKVLWPRLVDRTGPQDPMSDGQTVIFPKGRVRDDLDVKPRTLEILREAMLADVQDPDGTGRRAAVPGIRICGKTGTAQIMNERNQITGHTVWFLSFAPYENPLYAVVVVVESGSSGALTCAPVAGDIYRAIFEPERMEPMKPATLAQAK